VVAPLLLGATGSVLATGVLSVAAYKLFGMMTGAISTLIIVISTTFPQFYNQRRREHRQESRAASFARTLGSFRFWYNSLFAYLNMAYVVNWEIEGALHYAKVLKGDETLHLPLLGDTGLGFRDTDHDGVEEGGIRVGGINVGAGMATIVEEMEHKIYGAEEQISIGQWMAEQIPGYSAVEDRLGERLLEHQLGGSAVMLAGEDGSPYDVSRAHGLTGQEWVGRYVKQSDASTIEARLNQRLAATMPDAAKRAELAKRLFHKALEDRALLGGVKNPWVAVSLVTALAAPAAEGGAGLSVAEAERLAHALARDVQAWQRERDLADTDLAQLLRELEVIVAHHARPHDDPAQAAASAMLTSQVLAMRAHQAGVPPEPYGVLMQRLTAPAADPQMAGLLAGNPGMAALLRARFGAGLGAAEADAVALAVLRAHPDWLRNQPDLSTAPLSELMRRLTAMVAERTASERAASAVIELLMPSVLTERASQAGWTPALYLRLMEDGLGQGRLFDESEARARRLLAALHRPPRELRGKGREQELAKWQEGQFEALLADERAAGDQQRRDERLADADEDGDAVEGREWATQLAGQTPKPPAAGGPPRSWSRPRRRRRRRPPPPAGRAGRSGGRSRSRPERGQCWSGAPGWPRR